MEATLIELNGSEKQVQWANDIRKAWLESGFKICNNAGEDMILNITSAKTWIEYRVLVYTARKNGMNKKLAEQLLEMACLEDYQAARTAKSRGK